MAGGCCGSTGALRAAPHTTGPRRDRRRAFPLTGTRTAPVPAAPPARRSTPAAPPQPAPAALHPHSPGPAAPTAAPRPNRRPAPVRPGRGSGSSGACALRRPLAARAAVTSCPSAHPAPGSAAAALAGQGRIKFNSGRGKPALLAQVGARRRRLVRRALPSRWPRCHLPAAPPSPPGLAWRGGGRARLRLLRQRWGGRPARLLGRNFPPRSAPEGAEGRRPGGGAAGGGLGGGDGARRESGAAGAAR